MKKILVVGTASVLAVLPTMGVFAATGTTVTDTVAVTINTACSITSESATNSYTATLANGSSKNNWTVKTLTIACNNAAGWSLTAVGDGTVSGDKTKMDATGSGTDIATGTATSGATSNWAFKVTGTGTVTAFNSWHVIPATATDVANSTGSSAGVVITPAYQVYVSPTQQADTYTGKVKYTLVNPKNS